MSRRSSPRKKKSAAKVHRITKRHHDEVELTHYSRELDKIYTKMDMAEKVPQVVQKMRNEYRKNPHDFYLLVCRKYGVTPEEKFDTDLLVYGRKTHHKHKLEQDTNKERVYERKVVETNEKIETKVVVTSEKIETKVDEVTEKRDTTVEVETSKLVQDEEKKDQPTRFKYTEAELVQAAEAKPPERRIVTQTPRRAQIVDRMYMPQVAQEENSSRIVDQRYSPLTSSRASPRADSQQSATRLVEQRIEYVEIYVGDICETMVLTDSGPHQETGFWVPARVLAIDTEKEVMDLEVLQPVKYGLAKLANNVPNRYVRAPAQIIWKQ